MFIMHTCPMAVIYCTLTTVKTQATSSVYLCVLIFSLFLSVLAVCYGTSNGLTRMSYHVTQHYESLRRRYSGCTFVHGNLEITHLTSEDGFNFDLSFLATIRMVTGYVLMILNTVDVVPLTELVYVRGDSVYEHNKESYVFFMALNYVPKGIHMPALKGKISFILDVSSTL